MAVAAAIADDPSEDVMTHRLAHAATSRLSGKRSILRSEIPEVSQQNQSGLSEINRSIEKMTLQPMNNSKLSDNNKECKTQTKRDADWCKTTRRDSDWSSTEDPGYGSLRSDLNDQSRRCSELSSVNSQVGLSYISDNYPHEFEKF